MTSTVHFAEVRDAFDPDGSWRDIYAFQIGPLAWMAFMHAMLDSRWRVEMRAMDEDTRDPQRVLDAASREQGYGFMAIHVGRGRIHCNFFDRDEIELDLDPADFDEQNFLALLEFVQVMGAAVDRNIFVTEESAPEAGIFAFRVDTGSVEILRRPAAPTHFSHALGRQVRRVLEPFLAQVPGRIGDKVRVDSSAVASAHLWRTDIYTPDEFAWHTELTAEEYRVLRELDTAIDIFFGPRPVEDLCRIGGFKMTTLRGQFWRAMVSAQSAFGQLP